MAVDISLRRVTSSNPTESWKGDGIKNQKANLLIMVDEYGLYSLEDYEYKDCIIMSKEEYRKLCNVTDM